MEQILYVNIHYLKMRVNNIFLDENWNLNLLYTNILSDICDRYALRICLNSMVSDWLT